MRREEPQREIVPGADRALRNLRKEGGEKQHLEGVLFRPALGPVDVAQVADRLEGVKGNAQRQNPPDAVPDAAAEPAGDGICLRQQEVDVFERAEDPQVQQQAERQDPSAAGASLSFSRCAFFLAQLRFMFLQIRLFRVRVPLDPERSSPGGRRGDAEEQHGKPSAAGVEYQAESQQQPPLKPLRHQKIGDQKQG